LRPRRKTEGFNVAFLDIMSCGLGAIILVFMLIKHNVDTANIQSEQLLKEQADMLRDDLVQLDAQTDSVRHDIEKSELNTRRLEGKIVAESSQLSEVKKKLKKKQAEIADQTKALDSAKSRIENTEVSKTSDNIEDVSIGEESYLIGLRVEGRKIGILLDSSASMTDERLIDIIRRKNGSDKTKIMGPKWQRTKRILRWLIARLPRDSSVEVVAFNEKARSIGSRGWKPASNSNAVDDLLRGIDRLVPEGPTNLQVGLEAMRKLRPSNIYLITDGLPTKGDSNYKSLSPFAECSALWGKSNKISGECRKKLFHHTLKSSAPPGGVPVNIILLPIEGDPEAPTSYWSWTAATGGLLISPAIGWP
jgi:hypothetical protein